MSKVIQAQGEYKVKATGAAHKYEFDYVAYDNLQDMIDTLGEEKTFKLAQRQVKVDAGNMAREEAKVINGHSSRKAMTEEEKANAKAERQANKALLDKIKALPAHELAKLGL